MRKADRIIRNKNAAQSGLLMKNLLCGKYVRLFFLLQLRFHEIVSPDKACSGVSVYHRLLYLQFCIGML